MIKKQSDFLISFSIMIAGVFLLFIGSVFFNTSEVELVLDKSDVEKLVLEPGLFINPNMTGGDVYEIPAGIINAKPSIPLQKNKAVFDDNNLTAVSYVVIDDKTDRFLLKKNTDEVRSLASITKLVSALVLMDIGLGWNDDIIIENSDFIGGSHHVNIGEEFSIEDLWNVALVGSSNTSINALVRSTGKTRKEFVRLMNEKVKELNLVPMVFFDPTGLDSRNVGSARDVARILKEALLYDKIFQTLNTSEYYARPVGQSAYRQVWSTNWLLSNWIPNNFVKKDMAGKTGFINDSMYNFTMRVSDNNGHFLRVVVLGAEGNEKRFEEARDLVDWVFDNYLWPDEKGYDNLIE